MPKYQIDVVEVRHVSCTYTVQARNPREAIRKAGNGDTLPGDLNNIENGEGEVVDRQVNAVADELEPEAE